MKWGRKKSSPPSSSSWLITRVFPGSWFSKFKPKGGNLDLSSGKKQHRGKLDFPTRNSSLPACWREARFYSVDDDNDDAYWRLSFCEERAEGGRRTGRINPLLYNSDDEFHIPLSILKSFGFGEMELPRGEVGINDMVLDLNKMKEKKYGGDILREDCAFRKKKPNRLRREELNDRRSRKLHRGAVRKKKAALKSRPDHGDGKSSKLVERDTFPVEPENIDHKNKEFCDSDEGSNAASEDLENKKSQVKATYIRRRSHSSKIKQTRTKVYAPKTDCRIRVLEDMKKARMKLMKQRKQQATESSTIFNSFAVVKSSFNPQQDFRDSMVEMIRHKGISRSEELKELLACYLTLNSDEYHDLIIKVFQQVLFELSWCVY